MKNFNKKTVITMATALCTASLVGGVMASVNASAEGEVQTLAGFECAGASVNAQELGMRFVFDLTGDAVAKKDLTAGVVYMPYDMYKGDINAFVKGQEKSLTTEFNWQDNTATADETDMVGYTYLSANVIPSTMYNRVLLVRGYMEDGENVYYTEPVKTSMAYSAWKGIDSLPDYAEQLKTYMGPYTLTYEGGKIENLYYGDVVTGLPTQINGQNVEKWYWDADKTDDIAADDYATGSMNIYYELEKFTVSGTISCADDVDMTKVKISVDGVETDAVVSANGEYSLEVSAGTYDLKFYGEGYVAYANDTVVAEDTDLSVSLLNGLFDVGDYGTVKSTITDANFDGQITVNANQYAAIFPNTATTKDFKFTVKMDTVDEDKSVSRYGIVLTTGTKTLTIDIAKWLFVVNVGEQVGAAEVRGFKAYNNGNPIGQSDRTWIIKRTSDKIEFLMLGGDGVTEFKFLEITATGIVTNGYCARQDDSVHANTLKDSSLAAFFGDDVAIAVGIGSFSGTTAAQTTYNCSYEVAKDFSTAQWAVGNYNKVQSTVTDANEDGVLTTNANQYAAIFPNTATTKDFKFTVKMDTVDEDKSVSRYGIVLTTGTKTLTIDIAKWLFVVNVGEQVGAAEVRGFKAYNNGNPIGQSDRTWIIKRTSDKIEFLMLGGDGVTEFKFLEITATGIVTNGYCARQDDSVHANTLKDSSLAAFFGDDVAIAVGVGSFSGTTAAQTIFTCSYTLL